MQILKILTNSKKYRPTEQEMGFGKYFTDHMFTMQYSSGQGWNGAAIVPHQPFLIEPSAMVLHYGQSVFEGLKCYRGPDGTPLLFRPERNFSRLNVSCERMCIPRLDEELLLSALIELLKTDGDWIPRGKGTSLYIRPFVIATQGALGVHAAHDYCFMIILSPVGHYYTQGVNPVRIRIEEEYVRAVRGGTGFTKASANYAISLKGADVAEAAGFTQVMWLDGVERKYIEEVGSMNVFFKIGDEVVTPMLQGSVLPGITRDSVITLLRSWGIKVSERQISADELYEAHAAGELEEAFGTGTAAVISPIGVISRGGKEIMINNNENGPTTVKLYEQLTGIQYGLLPDDFHWVRKVV